MANLKSEIRILELPIKGRVLFVAQQTLGCGMRAPSCQEITRCMIIVTIAMPSLKHEVTL